MTDSTASSSAEPVRSLNKQVVLDEDEYTQALSQIIARDFFPSLVHLDATNEYLDALQTKDPHLINASVRRLEHLSTPSTRRTNQVWQTPAQTPFAAGPSDTPVRTPSGQPPPKRPRYDTEMSLDNFQARYTSEDNSSFTQILDDENRVRKEKWSWAWEAQKRVEQQRGRMIEQRERLLIEAPGGAGVREKFVIEAPRPKHLITASAEGDKEETGEAKEEVQRSVILRSTAEEEDEEVVDVMAPKKDTRPAGVDGWNFKTRNSLMFSPDADQSPYHSQHTHTATDPKAAPKVIKYTNTRLPEQDDAQHHSPTEPPSPTRSRIDAAIAGTPYRPRSPNNDTFSLVPAVPSPTPSQLGSAAVKQLMTLGSLTATPRVLSQSDDPADKSIPATPFRISEPSSREQLSHKLSANAAKSLRAKAMLLGGPAARTPSSIRGTLTPGRKGSMPPPSWTPRKAEAIGGLTPAARRLLDRTAMGTAASRRAQAMRQTAGWEGTSSSAQDRDLNRVRWTPTPSPVTRREG